ncbi:hypothetical protein FRB90_000201, partial [Tulasnella sp. 427]
MPSPLLLVQALFNRRIVTAEDETGDKFHNIADAELEKGRPSRSKNEGFVSRFRSRYEAGKSGSNTPRPDRDRDFADEEDEDEEDDEILDSPRADGEPSPEIRGADDSTTSPTLTPPHGASSPHTPRRRTIRHHDEENGGGGGDSSDATRREDDFTPVKRYDTSGSSSTWSWMPQPRTPGPIRRALQKTKYFIFQNDPTKDDDGN